jgi:hypothetical protein
MTIAYGPNLGLIIRAAKGEEWYEEAKQLLRWLDFLCAPYLLEVRRSPITPAVDGYVCLVDRTSLSGDFTTHANAIARYNGTDNRWEYLQPKNGWVIGPNNYTTVNGWNYVPDVPEG